MFFFEDLLPAFTGLYWAPEGVVSLGVHAPADQALLSDGVDLLKGGVVAAAWQKRVDERRPGWVGFARYGQSGAGRLHYGVPVFDEAGQFKGLVAAVIDVDAMLGGAGPLRLGMGQGQGQGQGGGCFPMGERRLATGPGRRAGPNDPLAWRPQSTKTWACIIRP